MLIDVEILKKCSILKNISEQSLYLIGHEISKKRIISKGKMVYSMLKRSAFCEGKKPFTHSLRKESINKTQTTGVDVAKESEDL